MLSQDGQRFLGRSTHYARTLFDLAVVTRLNRKGSVQAANLLTRAHSSHLSSNVPVLSLSGEIDSNSFARACL
ncbi:hypothetical protein KL86DES1_10734 [uncultured Desulfovibrio sp.]|uniref:Uncharacterized protein n=1 Tax=uncultured Desulfovibrio sp. TaxID=167968 RepID=A0A212L047_9BACT|nr:hypothetical protein KL86DES1_10734 [uncultured Desulfovibrio sp.]VZH32607.1 conserved protein of unknown function [Desulfovibrio sp. 86]